ncbi:MAG TPA: DUF6345 domain-containing protein [Candidatus Paceibacterota bacterium]|nr:DUF6345 domain-containing protein [Verrucomicrobiota bacterium]HSA12282.1 DUF6345 domain-containing protein [Candidatus Paceibacterota bacterium]
MKTMTRGMLILVIVGALQSGFSQNNSQPVLKVVKVRADQPAVLEWTSRTNEIYRVDYAPDLATNFTTAAEYIANQGTNTLWADIGTESVSYPRTSSADENVSYRFYRIAVQGYASNSFPATITISNAFSTLSGLTNILASVTSPSNVVSGSLLVDGNEVSLSPGKDYAFPLETRFFPNGTHRLTVSVQNDGDTGTTGGDDAVPDPALDGEASFAAQNATVSFNNPLSDVRLKYAGYRPDLGETQQVHAVWTSPRSWQVDITYADDTNTIYRSFTGNGTTVSVIWDGLDSSGQELSPQRIAYVIYDLGEFQQMSASAGSDFSTIFDAMELWAVPADGAGAIVPLAIYPPGADTNGLVIFEASASEIYPKRTPPTTQTANSVEVGGIFGPMDAGGTSEPFIVYSTYKTFGSFGMLYQGHHPLFGSYPRPPRGAPFGQVTFATGTGFPWGKLKAPKKIATYLSQAVRVMGYSVPFIYGDDNFAAPALQKSSLGGSNIFNTVNLGLFVGHSAAGKENIVALGHPQTYIPVYRKTSDSFTWIGMNDMDLGSSNLKWAAFYSCNLFRDSSYRSFGCYTQMKNNEHLAMNTDLHVMQAYATEVSVLPDMGKYWVVALIGGTGVSSDSTVLGAWKYVCRNTQPKESSANANVSRSIYWPECANDHIYGYGSQTDPDPFYIQAELLEDDQTAPTL